MPLRQHGTQPGRKTAAAVKIAKERRARGPALVDAIQIRVKRIGQLARTSGWVDRVGSPVQSRTHLQDEVIPRKGVAECTRTGERKIFEVKRTEVGRNRLLRGNAPSKCFCTTCFERGRKRSRRQTPPCGIRRAVELLGKLGSDAALRIGAQSRFPDVQPPGTCFYADDNASAFSLRTSSSLRYYRPAMTDDPND